MVTKRDVVAPITPRGAVSLPVFTSAPPPLEAPIAGTCVAIFIPGPDDENRPPCSSPDRPTCAKRTETVPSADSRSPYHQHVRHLLQLGLTNLISDFFSLALVERHPQAGLLSAGEFDLGGAIFVVAGRKIGKNDRLKAGPARAETLRQKCSIRSAMNRSKLPKMARWG